MPFLLLFWVYKVQLSFRVGIPCKKMFISLQAGDLGPGTIVGSAAFNLFMIIGLCMYVIPDDEVRKIK